MLKVTNKGSKNVVNLSPKRRGRPPKVRPSVIEEMKANNDPDIRFLRDLSVNDRTEIIDGKDPNFRYRWVEESKLRTREAQGYTKVSDPNIRTHFDGNYMPAEGYDSRMQNKGGMILCKIPESLAKKRDAMKSEKIAQQSQAAEARHVSEMVQGGGAVLGADDPFVAGLTNGE